MGLENHYLNIQTELSEAKLNQLLLQGLTLPPRLYETLQNKTIPVNLLYVDLSSH